MNFSQSSISSMSTIQEALKKAEDLFRSLSEEEKQQIHAFHNENYSLNHCIRWGVQAIDEIIEQLPSQTSESASLEVGEDLLEYLQENLEGIADSHLEAWKDRYHRKKLEDVVFDLRVNHDKDADIEPIEDRLGRELTTDERTYYYEAFIKEVEDTFYQ